ncbi:hypothetical protein [Helicobacter pylori]|uniref:hypothetical protein n=1 Tax=Helicobacter pylori TaxID=210 RepID=UPI0015E75EB2|nr:hypothetical protein [Helicobacter pylori]
MPIIHFLRIFKTIVPYVLIFTISFYVLKLKTKNTELKERLEYTQALIKQNEAIEMLELESQRYKTEKILGATKIKDKYREIIVKDSTCNEKLQSYESLLSAFRKNSP